MPDTITNLPQGGAAPGRRRWVTLRRLTQAAAAIAAFVSLWYGFENWRGWREWKAERDRVVGRGIATDLASYIPPTVPEAENFALIPIFKPLLEYDRTRPGLWLDTNAHREALGRFDLRRIHGGDREPEAGNWMTGKAIDLQAWQAWFRVPYSRHRSDPKMRERLGLAAIPLGGDDPTTAVPGYPLPAAPGRPAEDVLRALALFSRDFDALAEGARRPQSRFPLHYEEGYEGLLPHLAILKQINHRLALRASARLAEGDAAGAFADVGVALRVAESVSHEPFLISQLVRIAALDAALQPVWEAQVRHAWNDAQWTDLQKRLVTIDPLPSVQRAMGVERALLVRMIEQAVASSDGRRNLAGIIYQEPVLVGGLWFVEPSATYLALAPRGWLYASLAASSRALDPFEDLRPADVPKFVQFRGADTNATSIRLRVHRRLQAMQEEGVGLASAVVKTFRLQAHLRLAVVACALERHRISAGTYPETLAELSPRWLDMAPVDPIDGAPLRYRRDAPDRFTLWSVGADGRNDQGAWPLEASADAGTGDWVWRIPTPP